MIAGANEIKSCYIGPAVSPEQFIAEHFFLYLSKGSIEGYDGHQHYNLQPGEYCLARRNHLARYSKKKDAGEFRKVVVVFDRPFLEDFQKRHNIAIEQTEKQGAFILLNEDERIPQLLQSLAPYFGANGQVEELTGAAKREDLLLLLLEKNPALATVMFDFGIPQKIDLEAFMNRNYKFNVRLERLAYLTGRSLSAFKRDFNQLFQTTPSRWLIQRRLKEAYFLLARQGERASDIYLDLGFNDLSHFSFAFKKHFGQSPQQVAAARRE